MTHFTPAELCRSNVADRLGISNKIPQDKLQNLQALVSNVLDPLREWYGRPIYVNSGYRCPELNQAVGGAENSYHLHGMAADIDTRTVEDNRKLFDYIRQHLPFTELIWEKGGQWIHVAYDAKNLAKEVIG